MKQITTMKKVVLAAALLSAFSFNAMAQNHRPNQGGGFAGPSAALPQTTVKAAKDLKDDTYVSLTGYVVNHLGDDKYTFKDSTDEIVIEIDDRKWRGLTVNDKDLVMIKGEVDKGWSKIEIEVDEIQKVSSMNMK